MFVRQNINYNSNFSSKAAFVKSVSSGFLYTYLHNTQFLQLLQSFHISQSATIYNRKLASLNRNNVSVIQSTNSRYTFTLYDTRCYFNVRSKADISQLNLPHGVSLIYHTLIEWGTKVAIDIRLSEVSARLMVKHSKQTVFVLYTRLHIR